jgi:serine/threonine protein kinase
MGGSTLPLAPDAFSGRMLGKYEVLCRLSTGGMAEIFLASQRGLAGFRKLVVLKQILPDIKGEEEFVRMFLDEARVTAAFNHPNIAQVFDLDVADGELFLAMEFVQGATLVEVAKACRASNTPIPIGLSLASARDTALALHYAHTFTDPLGRPASVIHRDVAEKNIMVTYEGVTKLLDFGIAKNLARKGRTQIGMVKGTSGYMSPEQILGEPLDARSDLFSLGVVLHECLTGLRLFHAKTPADGAGAVLNGRVPAPSRANKAIPPELDAIVLKALSRKRDDRYASTLEFARALERAVGPLIWHPEQNAELIQQLFAERLAQTRKLLADGQVMSGDATGEVRVSQLFSLSSIHPPPGSQPPPEEEFEEDPDAGTQLNLPTITPALPASARPIASPALTAPPAVKPAPPPPPPPPEPQKPPTPPRGAPAPRKSTVGQIPSVQPSSPESASLRRPVFEPLPQKRASNPHVAPNEAVPPPPPPEDTGNTQPGEERVKLRPSTWTADENATRAAPPEEPARPAGRGRIPSRELRVNSEASRSRPPRVDMHNMGTVPHADGPPGAQSQAHEENEGTQQDSVAFKPSPLRPRTSSSARTGYTLPPRPPPQPPRRAPTPPPQEEEAASDIVTHQVRAYQPEASEEPEDTNESQVPDAEEGASAITTPGTPSIPRRGRGMVFALVGVLLLILGGGGAVVALGLDGGRISGLWASPAAKEPAATEPVTPPAPAQPPGGAEAQPPAPAPTGTASATPENTATPAPTPPAPTEPETPPTTPAPAPMGAEALALRNTPPEDSQPATSPEPTPEPVEEPTAVPPEEKPTPVVKKRTTPIKRTRKDSKQPEETSAPSDWAPVEPKEEPGSAEAPAAAGSGVLTLVTEPYAKVYLGKKYLGDTPLFKITMAAGKQTLRLVGPDGQSLKLPVEIKPGETTAVRIGLDSLAKE